MSLFHHHGGIFYRRAAEQLQDPHFGIMTDYWYMAKRSCKSLVLIDLLICTILYDHTGNRFECKSIHHGDYKPWKEVIRQQMEDHMLKYGVDKLMAKRIVRDMELTKDKLVPFDRLDFLYRKL